MRGRHFIPWLGAAALVISAPRVLAQTFLTYHCRDGSEFVVALLEDKRFAYLQLDGKAISLRRRLSLSGSRYSKGDITLRISEKGTTLERRKRSTECTAT